MEELSKGQYKEAENMIKTAISSYMKPLELKLDNLFLDLKNQRIDDKEKFKNIEDVVSKISCDVNKITLQQSFWYSGATILGSAVPITAAMYFELI